MKRTKRREFVMNEKEAEDLRSKARRACMSESQLIRLLIAGYQPPPAPGDDFHHDMQALLDKCDDLTKEAAHLRQKEGKTDILDEVSELRNLRRIFLRKYLQGERKDPLWP